MKAYRRQLKKITCVLIICLGVIACEDDQLFSETNTNNEAFSTLNPNLLLTTVQASLSGGRLEQWRTNLIYGGGFIQHFAGSFPVSNYGAFFKHNAAFEEALWQSNYADGVVRNLVDVLERTNNKEEYRNINAIAKILKVMVFQRLTDTYGDVPYSEAGQGFLNNILAPKYDDQKEIYDNFFVLLDEAYNQLSENTQEVITGDVFYDGDVAKWKKMSNSLRLRCAMRISKVNQNKAITEIQSAINNGVFESNEDSCLGRHEDIEFNTIGAQKNGNGFSHALKGNGSIVDHPTITLIQNLEGDPRKEMWFLPGNAGIIAGLSSNNYRWDHPGGSGDLARLQPYLYANDAPYMHLSYAEIQFLLAEAVQRGFIPGDAQSYYQNGIEAAILQWSNFGISVDAEDARTFAISKNLLPGNEIEEICTQQWLIHFMNGIEAFANYRRTGFPILEPITRSESDTNGERPKRLPYPGGEFVVNKENYEAARAKYPNGWLSPIWWDVD